MFLNATPTTEIYPLAPHDALPIERGRGDAVVRRPHRRHASIGPLAACRPGAPARNAPPLRRRSEEHTSELQSRQYPACRLLLGKTMLLVNQNCVAMSGLTNAS